MKKLSFLLMAMLMSIMSFAETYTHTFAKGEMKTGSVTLSGVTWNTAADPGTTAYNWDSQPTAKGIQIGTKNAPCMSYTFSTSHFVDYMVTNITVNASIASSGTAKMQVSVGGVDYIAQTALTTTATNYTGSGASQGDVVISFTNTSKAFYIKSISITYQAVSAGEGMILVDQSNVDFGKMTKTKTIVVTGQNLTSAITTSLKEGANFTVAGNLTAEGGELTVNYIATEAGKHTDVLVLTSDDVTTEVALAGEVVVLEGAGTKENPYTVADVIALGLTDKTQAWVEGYIIGTMKDNALEETPSQYSNIVLAAAADVKENYVPVALASGTNPRAALNIIDNPTMLGAKVAVYGTLETYFSKPGVKNVSDYEILSTVTPEPVMFTVTVTAENGTVTGDGEYEEGAEATLTATAAEGYEFVNWTSGETEVSTANPFTFTVTSDTTLVANFKEVVKAIEVKVTDATATSGEWSIDLAGSWNDQALTIKLWQDNTQGFGSYAPNTETGYYILLGAKELTPTTEGVYADNGDGTFTFTCSATDGTTQYNITVTGNNPTQGGGDEVYQIIDDAITNLTFNLDEEPYSCMGGPSKTYGIELYLVLGEDDGMGTFTLTSESVIGVMGAPATFISGYLTDIDPSAPAANAVIVAKLPDGSTFEFHIAMSSTPVDATVIVVENATLAIDSAFLFNNPISGDVYEYSLTMSGNWTDSTNTTYLVTVEFPVYDPATTEEQERLANIKVGDFAADDAPYLGMVEDYLTITNVNGVITAQGIVSQNGLAFDLTISGTLSQGPSTGVENLNGTVAPVKVIENGQIFIIRNGVKYNAQGAQL